MTELREHWRARIPGDATHTFLVDPAGGSVFVSDGWSVAFASLRLHRLDLHTGRHLADVRTRHQLVSAMAINDGNLYAATDSRLFELEPATLTTRRQWDCGLVRYTMQLLPDGNRLIAANWLMPSIGIFDPETGRTRRVKVGLQPLVFRHNGHVKVISGFDGGLATLDTQRSRLVDPQPTPPIARTSAGTDVWGIAAGPPRGGQGNPPVWTKEGSNVLLRLTGRQVEIRLPADCGAVYADDARRLVWCQAARPGGRLWAVAQDTGAHVGSYAAPPGFQIQHVSPSAGVAFATGLIERQVEDNVVRSATCTCACLDLP